jgi:hypothetical protein
MKKKLLMLSFILTILIEFSCSKKNHEMNSLVGKWSVVNDSILNSNFIVHLRDSTLYNGNYIGQPEDHFNFTSNGTLGIQLDSDLFAPLYDSAKYNVTSNNQVEISNYFLGGAIAGHYINPVESRTYVISNLTSHTATLTFQTVYPSAENVSGIETEIINLKK